MKCEVEFLAVGEHSKPGDAIVIRYGEPDDFQLMLVDGGTSETGQTIVQHIRTQFPNQARLEHVVLTHLDSDHACGLREVLNALPVANLWVNIPWVFAKDTLHLFSDTRWTAEGLAKAIRDSYPVISEIIDIACAKGINIQFPFEGHRIGPFVVTSPSVRAYLHLIPQFRKTPDPDQAAIEREGLWIGKAPKGIVARLLEAAARVAEWIPESWGIELLRDGGKTGADNESSVVLYGATDQQRLLLTGDAGINALTWTINYANRNALGLQQFTFVQVPHHGSRRNVGPTVLNALLGPKLPAPNNRFAAFISAPKDDASHPRRIVVNAFMRRGATVVATQGSNKVHWGGFPARAGYSSAEVMTFSNHVEAYD